MSDRTAAGPLEHQLRAHLAAASREVILIAPFIKEPVLRRLLDGVATEGGVHVITRWRLDEIVAGVSDLEVWPTARDRGASLSLLDNLHAKVFIADNSALIGSANLTNAALAGPDVGNLELLTLVDRENPAVAAVELFVSTMSVPATDELYEAYKSAVDLLPRAPEQELSWYPRFRRPRELLSAARAEPSYAPAQVELARSELAALGLPPDGSGVNVRIIAAAVSLQPLVRSLHAFADVEGGRRFGELRDWMARRTARADADPQTLLRWVREFLPDQFQYSRPRFSERLATRRHERVNTPASWGVGSAR